MRPDAQPSITPAMNPTPAGPICPDVLSTPPKPKRPEVEKPERPQAVEQMMRRRKGGKK